MIRYDFGQIIRARRRSLGISQNDLAKLTGLHQGTISELERGERAPDVRTVELALKPLGLELRIIEVNDA